MHTPLTSEQKLDEIYNIVKSQQSARSRSYWYRIIKWMIIFAIAYFTLSNPGYVTGKIMEYVGPIMVEQMKGIMATQKDGLLKQMKDLIPKDQVPTSDTY